MCILVQSVKRMLALKYLNIKVTNTKKKIKGLYPFSGIHFVKWKILYPDLEKSEYEN